MCAPGMWTQNQVIYLLYFMYKTTQRDFYIQKSLKHNRRLIFKVLINSSALTKDIPLDVVPQQVKSPFGWSSESMQTSCFLFSVLFFMFSLGLCPICLPVFIFQYINVCFIDFLPCRTFSYYSSSVCLVCLLLHFDT